MFFKFSLLCAAVAAVLAAPSAPSQEGQNLLMTELPLPEPQLLVDPREVRDLTEEDQFIINGRDVNPPGKYPWQISLQGYGSHICGGSIVSESLVLTAAHCIVYSASTLKVVVGLHDQRKTAGKPKIHAISKISVHESYNNGAGTYPNDIAFIHLAVPIVFDQFAQKVGLDLEGEHDGNSNCVITGWGYTQVGLFPTVANVLQEANTTLLTNTECKQFWPSSYIIPSHICIYSGYNSACMGDSGGPLVCKKADGAYTLVGLTSWGNSRCSVSMPGVYTRLSEHKAWINRKM